MRLPPLSIRVKLPLLICALVRAAARAAMRPVGPAAQQIADVELVSTGGARLLSLTDSASHGTPAVNPEMVLAGSRSDSGVIRPFEIVRDSLRYAVTAPVKEG